MENVINRDNYEKFIQMARTLNKGVKIDVDEHAMHPEMWAFDLEGIARLVDVAYCEGQIAELTRDESYAEDTAKIERLGALQTQIENSLPEDFVEVIG